MRCASLRALLQTAQASLMCFRIARLYVNWLSRRTNMPPYVLVTDWRQTQPCVNAIGSMRGLKHPAMLVIVCESERQRARASEWAASLSEGVLPVWAYFNGGVPPCELLGAQTSQVPISWFVHIVMTQFGSDRCGPEQILADSETTHSHILGLNLVDEAEQPNQLDDKSENIAETQAILVGEERAAGVTPPKETEVPFPSGILGANSSELADADARDPAGCDRFRDDSAQE